jgi:hypothetical protein
MTTCSLLDRWSRLFLIMSPLGSDDARNHKAKAVPGPNERNCLFFEEILKETHVGLTRAVIRYRTRKRKAGVSYWNLYFAR